jgi:hypothetical protein
MEQRRKTYRKKCVSKKEKNDSVENGVKNECVSNASYLSLNDQSLSHP